MISPALQQLYDEHDIILMAADRLRNMLDSPTPFEEEPAPFEEEPDLSIRSEELRALLTFFREYADGYHHQKEEDILFPALAEANPAMEMLTGSLTEHHVLFREALTNAQAMMETNDWETARITLRAYIADLADHISAENDELFVAAEDMLAESDKERIHFQFLDGDRELGLERKRLFEEEVKG